MPFIFEFDFGRTFLSIRLGRWEMFAQREIAPAARLGFTSQGKGSAILDVPGWSIAFADEKRWREGRAERQAEAVAE